MRIGSVKNQVRLTTDEQMSISAAVYSRDDALYMPLARRLWEAYVTERDERIALQRGQRK